MSKEQEWRQKEIARTKQLYGNGYAEVQRRRIHRNIIKGIDDAIAIGPEESVLEIGSTNGDILNLLLSKTPHVFGLNFDMQSVKIAQEESPASQVVVGDATRLPFGDGTFDKIIITHTAEHIDGLGWLRNEIKRTTKTKAEYLFITPRERFLGERALGDAFKTHRHPIKALRLARQLHVHTLNLSRVLDWTKGDWANSREVRVGIFPPRYDYIIRVHK